MTDIINLEERREANQIAKDINWADILIMYWLPDGCESVEPFDHDDDGLEFVWPERCRDGRGFVVAKGVDLFKEIIETGDCDVGYEINVFQARVASKEWAVEMAEFLVSGHA